jgi:hypothetical protein
MWTFGRVQQLVKEALREVDKNLSIKEGLDDLIQQLMVTIQASDRCQLARKLTGFSCTLKLLRQNARLYVVAKHVKVDTFDALSKCQAQLRKFSKWSWKNTTMYL